MNEKKVYVEPAIEAVDMAATGETCEPTGPIPNCPNPGPEIDAGPLS